MGYCFTSGGAWTAAIVGPGTKARCVIAGCVGAVPDLIGSWSRNGAPFWVRWLWSHRERWSREFRHPSIRALRGRASRRRTRGVEAWWGAIYAAAMRGSAKTGHALPPHRGHSTRRPEIAIACVVMGRYAGISG